GWKRKGVRKNPITIASAIDAPLMTVLTKMRRCHGTGSGSTLISVICCCTGLFRERGRADDGNRDGGLDRSRRCGSVAALRRRYLLHDRTTTSDLGRHDDSAHGRDGLVRQGVPAAHPR